MAKQNEAKWKFGNLTIDSGEIEYWFSELRLGKAFRKKHFYDDESNTGKAVDCLNYYLGQQEITKLGIETPIVDNQIVPIVNVFLASIMHQSPDILVKMKRETNIPMQREITKSVFDYFQEELKMEWHNQQVLFDSYVMGLGVKTNGYNSEFDVLEEKEKIKKKVKKRKGKGRGKGWKTVEEEVEEEIVRRKEWITKEFPFNLRHSPFLTIVDPRSKSSFPYDGKWICLEYELPYHEVKANPNFENTDEIAPTGAVGTDKDKTKWDDYKQGMCRIYQIQISRKDGLHILTLAKDYDKPLRYVKYPFEVEGFLTRFLTLNDTADQFYAPSDIERLIPLQDEINYIQSKLLEAIYKFLPKIGMNMDFFKDEQEAINVVEKGDIGSILINHGQSTPNQATQVLNFQLQLNDKIIVLQNLKNNLRLISGVTEAELTGQTDAKTATEASIGQRGSFSRIVARRERVRRFLKEDLRIFKQICMQACDWPLITKITGIREQDPITGEMVTEKWLRLNKVNDAIAGEYDLDIDIISGQQPNLELKRRQILETMNFLFSPVVEQKLAREGMKVDATIGIKEFLRTMDQFREAQHMVVPMSAQEQQALQQQQLLEQGGPEALAVAPQGLGGPLQGEAQTQGQLFAETAGTI